MGRQQTVWLSREISTTTFWPTFQINQHSQISLLLPNPVHRNRSLHHLISLDLSAKARDTACLIHQDEYVLKRNPFSGSNLSTAFISPKVPERIESNQWCDKFAVWRGCRVVGMAVCWENCSGDTKMSATKVTDFRDVFNVCIAVSYNGANHISPYHWVSHISLNAKSCNCRAQWSASHHIFH